MTNDYNILKSALSYYGGKHHLLSRILPLIPPHQIYTETFFGGGAVFFAKEPAKIEAINDVNNLIINFYKVAKLKFKKLQRIIDATLCSEEEYKKAKQIYLNPEQKEYDEVIKAWAVFVLSNQSYLNAFTSGWKSNRNRNMGIAFTNKKALLSRMFVKRLEQTQIFCRDALRVLKNMDSPTAFHFIDPPYIGANQGHYAGYTIKEFERLLQTCEELKGKFLLTTYPSQILSEYAKKNGWVQIELEMRNFASSRKDARKTEVFTMNYHTHKNVD
jgi:DNA adenine methylase